MNSRVHVLTTPQNKAGVFGLTANNGESFAVHSATHLMMNIVMQYRTVPNGPRDYRLRTVAYAYALEDAETTQELFAYHWHPETRNSVSFPHLHISAASGQLRPEYARAHFDTGRVTLEEVIHLSVRDFGVEPTRDDWVTVLEKSRATFNASRSWPR